ncbi:MAG: phosphatidylserine/phosphatidylglycerophosphate/cardiolipin synthase family protein [Vicinamibacterales bacterium]
MAWTIIAVAFIVWLVLVVLFTPRIDYRVTTPLRPDSDDFLHVVQSTCQAAVHSGNRVAVFTNGGQFYPAMRDAIRAAESSVNLEAYIFRPGEATMMIIDALVERAAAGVEVRLVLDAIGSAGLGGDSLRRLRGAGCRVSFYQPIAWYRLHRLNNRTHRELLVVDGRVAFTGGAGVADRWIRPEGKTPAWRDSMARIEGPIVAALQGVFAENWLECCGEILTGPRHWPPLAPAGETGAMLVKSSPSDRATVSRVVFQMLIEGAVSNIDISTPYFLPDRALRRALVRSARRGVAVRVVAPGRHSDQRLVRLASRRMYRELLEGGIRIYEYRPSMTHVKALMVDDTWAVIGTTNVDNRSFEHNDEVNVAFKEAAVTQRLRRDFEADVAASDEITLEAWRSRPAFEKLVGPICWILERQQ